MKTVEGFIRTIGVPYMQYVAKKLLRSTAGSFK